MATKALQFDIVGRCSVTKARTAVLWNLTPTNYIQILTLPHGPVETPVFMPVATAVSRTFYSNLNGVGFLKRDNCRAVRLSRV